MIGFAALKLAVKATKLTDHAAPTELCAYVGVCYYKHVAPTELGI